MACKSNCLHQLHSELAAENIFLEPMNKKRHYTLSNEIHSHLLCAILYTRNISIKMARTSI